MLSVWGIVCLVAMVEESWELGQRRNAALELRVPCDDQRRPRLGFDRVHHAPTFDPLQPRRSRSPCYLIPRNRAGETVPGAFLG